MSRRFSYYGSLGSCPAISAEAEAVVANIESNSGEVLDCDERQRVEAIVTGDGGFSSVDGSHSHIDILFHPLKTSAKSLAFWTSPGSATLVNSPTFVSGIGFDLDGVDQYIDTGIDLTTLSNYSMNNAFISSYVTSSGSNNNQALFGTETDVSNSIRFIAQPSNSRWVLSINSARTFPGNLDGNIFKPFTTYTGLRFGGGIYKMYKNGIEILSTSLATSSVPSRTLYFGALHSSGTSNFFQGELSGGVVGKAFGFSFTTWNTLMQANIGTL